MEMSKKTLDLCEKIASMLFVKVPAKQIADFFNWPEDRIKQIVENETFQNFYTEFCQKEVSRQYDLASGWDKIEQKAQKIILETLENICDPDFALRAAAVANKSSRKGLTNTAEPLNIKGGARTTIVLNVNYTKKIEDKNGDGNGNGNGEKVLDIEYEEIKTIDENTDVMPLDKLKEFMDHHSGNISANEVSDAEINAAAMAIR